MVNSSKELGFPIDSSLSKSCVPICWFCIGRNNKELGTKPGISSFDLDQEWIPVHELEHVFMLELPIEFIEDDDFLADVLIPPDGWILRVRFRKGFMCPSGFSTSSGSVKNDRDRFPLPVFETCQSDFSKGSPVAEKRHRELIKEFTVCCPSDSSSSEIFEVTSISLFRGFSSDNRASTFNPRTLFGDIVKSIFVGSSPYFPMCCRKESFNSFKTHWICETYISLPM